jgi:hypothetical protein
MLVSVYVTVPIVLPVKFLIAIYVSVSVLMTQERLSVARLLLIEIQTHVVVPASHLLIVGELVMV